MCGVHEKDQGDAARKCIAMNEVRSATKGDWVKVVFGNGDQINGTVEYTPCAVGDSWVIIAENGTIYHVARFESIEVTSRKVTV